MSRWYDMSYEERREARREEERQYRANVMQDVWRSGGNPDNIDYERVGDNFSAGAFAEEAARAELRAQRPKPREEEQFPEEMQEDEA